MNGPIKVVQVLKGTAANKKAAGCMLTIQHPYLFWIRCAAHCVDVMLEDFSTYLVERLYFKSCVHDSFISTVGVGEYAKRIDITEEVGKDKICHIFPHFV